MSHWGDIMDNRWKTPITFLLPIILLIQPQAKLAADRVKPPIRGLAEAVIVEKGPPCDGTIEGPVWKKCPEWPMGACTSERPHKYKAWAKVLFGPTHVYVGVYCEEGDTEGIVATTLKRDAAVWNDDSVEVFLRPDPQQPYYQFVTNPRGTLYDARDRQAEWDSTAEVKATIQRGKAWIATFEIPMKEISAYVGEDQIWTMNIYRSRPARAGEPALQYSWSIMGSCDYHAIDEFGVVTGVSVPRRNDGVTRVRNTPPPKVAVPNPGTEVGGVTVYYRMLFNSSKEHWLPANEGKLSITGDAVDGKALRVGCDRSWAGASLPISVVGSQGCLDSSPLRYQ